MSKNEDLEKNRTTEAQQRAGDEQCPLPDVSIVEEQRLAKLRTEAEEEEEFWYQSEMSLVDHYNY